MKNQSIIGFKMKWVYMLGFLFACCLATELPALNPPPGCPPSSMEGYTNMGEYGGHTYFVSNFTATGPDAITIAAATGGHLVTIADQGENDFVSSITGGAYAWIGFTDQDSEGNFVWVTGEPVTYTNWCAREPNNSCCGGENWTAINWWCGGGRWNDLYSPGWKLPFVVEFSTTGDDDCDGVLNECDLCPGGDDSGPCDATTFPGFESIPASWVCHPNGQKVSMCHNGNTICVNENAVQAHLDHGDFLGPCTSCGSQNLAVPNFSFDETTAGFDMEIFPNPASTKATVHLHGLAEDGATLSVFDIKGQEILRQDLADGQQHIELDLPEGKFANGKYFVRVTSDEKTLVKSLIINK